MVCLLLSAGTINANQTTAASKTLDKSLKDIRAGVSEKTVDIFSGYRKIFSGSHPPGQLVLPENLKEFSMYMLSLIKSRAIKGKTAQFPFHSPSIGKTRSSDSMQADKRRRIDAFTTCGCCGPSGARSCHCTCTPA